jgi:hypothetical protein
MMLLAMAVGALVAFAAPAAQADVWVTHDSEVGETTETAHTVNFTGSLSSTKGPVKITCAAAAHTKIWNVGGTEATGEVLDLNLVDPCTVAVNVGGGTFVDVCEVEEATTEAFPWHVNVATGANGIDIEGANFTNKFKGCLSTLGIPDGAKLGAAGTATGTWTNTGGCIVFSESGDLKDGGGADVKIDGSVCNSSVTLAD